MVSQNTTVEFEAALVDPAAAFRHPQDVVLRADLGPEQKAAILCRWAYDATELAVAEEEGMGGGERSDLGAVIDALHRLRGAGNAARTGPTKHAGFCPL